MSGIGARGPYENPEYEPEYNRRDYYQHSPNYGGNFFSNIARNSIIYLIIFLSIASGGTGQVNPNSGLNPNHNRSHVNR